MKLAHLAAALSLLLATCYNPKIEDGALGCSAFGECPEGFTCAPDRRCYSDEGGGPGGSTAGTGGMAGTGGRGGMPVAGRGGTGGVGGAGGVAMMCMMPYGPFAGCPAKTSSGCDPVCQAGCSKCGDRCNFEGSMGSVCKTQAGPFRMYNETCNPKADTCRPGAICLEEARTECEAHCYKYCRADGDCPDNAKCTVDIAVQMASTDYKVCSPPAQACNPFGPNPNCVARDRPFPMFGCYVLSAKYPDTTVCDCSGTKKLMDACEFEHDCQPGAECVKVNNEARCRRVCAVGVAGVALGGCAVGQTCVTFTGGTKFGYCR